MIDEIRTQIQSKLEEIDNIDTSAEVQDDLLQKGKTYFSFSLQADFTDSNFDENYRYRISLTGYLKRKEDQTENTLQIIDIAKQNIQEKLKELNIRTSMTDLNILDSIRKSRITGWVYYNEITNSLN